MTITSAPRTATVGALLAVAAGLIAPNNLIAFYLTSLAAALLLFAAEAMAPGAFMLWLGFAAAVVFAVVLLVRK